MLLCKENYERALCSLIVDTSGTVIVGYEYTYDDLGRILSEIHLAKNIKYDYTYDSLSRVTKRTLTNLSDNTTSEEVYAYDNAGNITSCTVSNGANTFVYDQNNRLISCNGQAVTYDMDGNMLSATLNGAQMSFVYDSANRLISAGQNSYTYNVEDVRIRNLCSDADTVYTYNTNAKLSQLLQKTTNGIATKYVYGLGLIGEEKNGEFKTYHFDFRGSTVAITDSCGNITDAFKYDTYGRLVSRTGNSFVIFGYNGRDGVVTDRNGLLYMRARYYSPDMHRFVNADIIPGEISNAVTLNRYAYANGNPVSNTDPFGLSAERGDTTINPAGIPVTSIPYDILQQILSVHNRKSTNFFYSDDYKNHVRVKVDQSGNITYSFTNYHDGLIADVQTTTNYYFVVQSAGVWKEQLDFKIETENLFNNEYVELINQITEFFTPPNGPLEKLEFYAGIFQVTTSVLAYLIGDSIVHNSETSAYLYDKVIYRDSSEEVPILKSVTTIEATKYFWQDSFTSKTIAERVLF